MSIFPANFAPWPEPSQREGYGETSLQIYKSVTIFDHRPVSNLHI